MCSYYTSCSRLAVLSLINRVFKFPKEEHGIVLTAGLSLKSEVSIEVNVLKTHVHLLSFVASYRGKILVSEVARTSRDVLAEANEPQLTCSLLHRSSAGRQTTVMYPNSLTHLARANPFSAPLFTLQKAEEPQQTLRGSQRTRRLAAAATLDGKPRSRVGLYFQP